MQIATVRARIDRRLLINYRVEAGLALRFVPEPLRPQIVDGNAIGGICLVRLTGIRPARAPVAVGLGSDHAAHRFAVVDADGRPATYVMRRDTDSRLEALLGGRVFPGALHHARFRCHETLDRFHVSMCSDDGSTRVEVKCRVDDRMAPTSVFEDRESASSFFEQGSLGYSGIEGRARIEAIELCTDDWYVQPLHVEYASSSFFDDWTAFPPGSVEFDSGLVMRGVDHEWQPRDGPGGRD